jgi:hypothetical protein
MHRSQVLTGGRNSPVPQFHDPLLYGRPRLQRPVECFEALLVPCYSLGSDVPEVSPFGHELAGSTSIDVVFFVSC